MPKGKGVEVLCREGMGESGEGTEQRISIVSAIRGLVNEGKWKNGRKQDLRHNKEAPA